MKDHFFLPRNASKARLREAEHARQNRAEIVKAFSQGQVSRRDLIKWGLITSAGTLAPISGLSAFAPSAYADGGSSIPTGRHPARCSERSPSPSRCRALMCCREIRFHLSIRRRRRNPTRPSSRLTRESGRRHWAH